jgi:sugar (pentulose or hexulose) kinase
MVNHYLAFDLGARSIRTILGYFQNGKLYIKQLARSRNEAINVLGNLQWNALGMYSEIIKGMAQCYEVCSDSLQSIGIDTWGVDFALLDSQGSLIGSPFASRDKRTRGTKKELIQKIPEKRLYQITGQASGEGRTLFQLYSMVRDGSPQLETASDLLFMPDLFNYFLTGVKKSEFSVASSTLLYNLNTNAWEQEIFDTLGLPMDLMQEVVEPITYIGNLTHDSSLQTGLKSVPVIAVVSHDTGSAVTAIPTQNPNVAYISSGTMSLIGIETDKPTINEKTRKYNFGNQGGAYGTNRLIRNLQGFWILHECLNEWVKERDYSFDDLLRLAEDTVSLGSIIYPDYPGFVKPPSMPDAIIEYCRITGQPTPRNVGQFVRIVLESLALSYRHTINQIHDIGLKTIERIHIVGGGSQNRLLNQFTANATGLPVYAGPIEASAIGNILVQAMYFGEISNIGQAREIVELSFQQDIYEPNPSSQWDEAYVRYLQIQQDEIYF